MIGRDQPVYEGRRPDRRKTRHMPMLRSAEESPTIGLRPKYEGSGGDRGTILVTPANGCQKVYSR
jgi:hypothetical protein